MKSPISLPDKTEEGPEAPPLVLGEGPEELVTEPPRTSSQVQGLAQRVIDLVAAGETPAKAVELVAPKAVSGPVRRLLERLNTEQFVTADLQRAALRQGDFTAWADLLQRGLKALESSGDPALLKEALAYSRVLRADPQVGLNAPPTIEVNLDMRPLARVLEVRDSAGAVFGWQDEEKKSDE